MGRFGSHLLRIVGLLVLAAVALQLYFLARIALMIVVDPQSTSFQRSEMWRLAVEKHAIAWSQEWRDYPQLADPLKRAVIASEDAGFADHSGVEWDALEKAWEKNQRAEDRAERVNERLAQRAAALAERAASARRARPPPKTPAPVLQALRDQLAAD